MSDTELQQSRLRRILPDLAAFAIGLGAARYFRWQTADLVWSLWLSSLLVGYLSLLIIIGAGLYAGLTVVGKLPAAKPGVKPLSTAGALFLAVFMLGFFSLHFCGFHAGHAAFLGHFFPLPGIDSNLFSTSFVNPPRLLAIALTQLLPLYGWFVLASMISERRQLLEPALKALQFTKQDPEKAHADLTSKDPKRNPTGDYLFRPYLNVIRMHLLIFVFAGTHALDIDSFAIFTIVYAAYFFPWSIFRRNPHPADLLGFR